MARYMTRVQAAPLAAKADQGCSDCHGAGVVTVESSMRGERDVPCSCIEAFCDACQQHSPCSCDDMLADRT